jgi:hypothetical protein
MTDYDADSDRRDELSDEMPKPQERQPADGGPEAQPLETVDHDELEPILLVPQHIDHLSDCADRWLSCHDELLVDLEAAR